MSGYLFKGFIYPVQNKHHSGDCIKATFSNQGTLFPFPSNIFFWGGGEGGGSVYKSRWTSTINVLFYILINSFVLHIETSSSINLACNL